MTETKSKSSVVDSLWREGERADGWRFFVRKHKKVWSQSELCDHVVTQRGFEPRTHCLKGSCSAD